MITSKPIVGIVSFTDPRSTSFVRQREEYIERKHAEVVKHLAGQGFQVIDPMKKLREGWKEIYGVQTPAEVRRCAAELTTGGAEALIIGCWHWTEPMLPYMLVRDLNLPTLLYTEDDPTWAGAVNISAVGASLWEAAPNRSALAHHRARGDLNLINPWARGVAALGKLKKSSVLLWGGSYCLRMEHLQDDIPELKSFLVNDILSEDQYMLVRRAEKIEKNEPKRIEDFAVWYKEGGGRFEPDGKMLTEEIWRKQIALYLAARDRLAELQDEEIVGVSIKCQPELSVEYGYTACMLPGFLPFGEDSEGKRAHMATVCEGDIKGLLSCALLGRILPETPPLFGDLKYVCKDYILISNCGGSSIYYAVNSSKAKNVLPKVCIGPQCQGAAGGAVGYNGQPGAMTVARLTRIQGEYYMQLGLGQSREITPEVTKNILWGQSWPHIAIDLGVDPQALIRIAGSNHYSAIPGDYTREVAFACRQAGIPIIRIDSDDAVAEALDQIPYL